jgi:glycosyltransferase involved in cell wall biosynthesis
MNQKLRILHAPTNIANQMTIISRAQQELGYSSYSCSFSNNWFNYKSDQCLNLEKIKNKYHRIYREFKFFTSSILKYDVFHFHFGNTLLPRYYDLPILKRMNKKMVMHYWGSEIRQKNIAERKNKFALVIVKDENEIRHHISTVAKYIKTVIVVDYELYEYIQGYFKKVVIVRQALNIQDYKPVIPSLHKERLLIVHAPSDKRIKGTNYILQAVTKLKKEYNFKFVLIHKIPHQKAKEIYSRADIIVDQLLLGGYGLVSIEEYLKNKYPKELPIISANPDTIYSVLKILIKDAKLRHELGERGRAYVEKHHDARKIAGELIKVYESL